MDMANFNHMTLQIDGKEPIAIKSCSVTHNSILRSSTTRSLFGPEISHQIKVEMDFEPDGAEVIQSALGNDADLKLKVSNREINLEKCHLFSYNYSNSSLREPHGRLQLNWSMLLRSDEHEPINNQPERAVAPRPQRQSKKRKIDWLRTGF